MTTEQAKMRKTGRQAPLRPEAEAPDRIPHVTAAFSATHKRLVAGDVAVLMTVLVLAGFAYISGAPHLLTFGLLATGLCGLALLARAAIEEGLAEADRGEFVTEEDLRAIVAKHVA